MKAAYVEECTLNSLLSNVLLLQSSLSWVSEMFHESYNNIRLVSMIGIIVQKLRTFNISLPRILQYI